MRESRSFWPDSIGITPELISRMVTANYPNPPSEAESDIEFPDDTLASAAFSLLGEVVCYSKDDKCLLDPQGQSLKSANERMFYGPIADANALGLAGIHKSNKELVRFVCKSHTLTEITIPFADIGMLASASSEDGLFEVIVTVSSLRLTDPDKQRETAQLWANAHQAFMRDRRPHYVMALTEYTLAVRALADVSESAAYHIATIGVGSKRLMRGDVARQHTWYRLRLRAVPNSSTQEPAEAVKK